MSRFNAVTKESRMSLRQKEKPRSGLAADQGFDFPYLRKETQMQVITSAVEESTLTKIEKRLVAAFRVMPSWDQDMLLRLSEYREEKAQNASADKRRSGFRVIQGGAA